MPAQFIQANTNGRLHSAHEPSLSPLNRGFLYGDAIYEVWRTYAGVVFAWEEHWQRLERSAAALHLSLPWPAEQLLEEVRRTVAAYRQTTGEDGDVYIRLQIARGEGPIGLDPALAEGPVYVLLVQPVPRLTTAKLNEGQRLSIARDLRRNDIATLDPAWKTGNYLNNLLCLREARSRGADEVVILNLRGEVTEAAVCNLAFVQAGRVLTPPRPAGILHGITRVLLLTRVAPQAGVPVEERTIREGDLATFDECFLLSTTKDVQPVAAIDDHRFAVGVDTVTRRLKQAFAAYAAAEAVAHPERRV